MIHRKIKYEFCDIIGQLEFDGYTVYLFNFPEDRNNIVSIEDSNRSGWAYDDLEDYEEEIIGIEVPIGYDIQWPVVVRYYEED